MDPILLCLDSGTTAVKAAAFDRHGRLLAVAQSDNNALRREGQRVEQDMTVTRDDAFHVLRDCVAQIDAGAVQGLIVTGQGDGLWPVDSGGEPVGRAMTWLDGRARALAGTLGEAGAFADIEAVTFSRPTAASQTLHLLWLQLNDPSRLARIAHALRCKEWLFLSLTGTLMGEPSAALPVWGDWRTNTFSPVVQESLGLQRGIELLPPFLDVGECRASLKGEAAAAIGLAAGLPVLLGPGDVQATLIGMGLGTRTGVTRASIFGTSAIHACFLLDPNLMREKPAGAMVQRFVLDDGYLCFHPSFNGATLFSHVAKLTGQPASVSVPSYSGVVMHPFFEPGGERAPYTSPHASGALFGVTAATKPADLAWAAREALCFVARKSHDMMNAPANRLTLGGGLAGDAQFARFLSTIMGTEVERNTAGHAGLRGLGAVGAKVLFDATKAQLVQDWITEPDEVLAPGHADLLTYAEEKYALFSKLLDAACGEWGTVSTIADRAQKLMEGSPA
ncbi:carbohydrate kinase [Tianweitania sp. BSSL-BM11]|uniref:Carbohydrate kinase n=1 Tax=Tianweitania aestuarii TaxID=2814886 RepID=A0ABS5S0D3_9HYPH|nr:FGGY family carbohydrate kinase [Tianweitania aestuarii]MBS9721377.1 carbohydrate kinase [Tianweitania aestuarii]